MSGLIDKGGSCGIDSVVQVLRSSHKMRDPMRNTTKERDSGVLAQLTRLTEDMDTASSPCDPGYAFPWKDIPLCSGGHACNLYSHH